jgi:serine protease Do/serine protease DegQ
MQNMTGPRLLVLTVLMLFVATPFGNVHGALPASVDGRPLPSLAPMLENVTSTVVNISTKTFIRVQENPLLSDPFFRYFFNVPRRSIERERSSLGSGVIVDAANGYVLTNNHVIHKADEITVTLSDGRQFSASLVGTDPEADVAVIQIDADGLNAIPLADSDELRVGDFVVAIGNPFGLGQTVTSGIVSALGRSGLGIEGYEDFIQTDASINPGNSGGALVNLRGELVGINTAIVGPSGGNVGIGFAIPTNMAHNIMTQLVRFGEVRRGQLGVRIQDLTPELGQAFGIKADKGVVVAQIIPGSPAEQAGLMAGDVITEIDGRKVRNASDLRNMVGMKPVGEQATVKVEREGKVELIPVEIRPLATSSSEGKSLDAKLAGAVFSELDESHPLFDEADGVRVSSIEAGSPAWRAGLREDDIIISINRVRIHGLQDMAKVLKRVAGRLLLHVRRGDAAVFVLVE